MCQEAVVLEICGIQYFKMKFYVLNADAFWKLLMELGGNNIVGGWET